MSQRAHYFNITRLFLKETCSTSIYDAKSPLSIKKYKRSKGAVGWTVSNQKSSSNWKILLLSFKINISFTKKLECSFFFFFSIFRLKWQWTSGHRWEIMFLKWRPRSGQRSEGRIHFDRLLTGMNMIDEGESTPLIVAFYGRSLYPAVDFYMLMITLTMAIQALEPHLKAQPNGIFPRVSDVARYFHGILTILTSCHIYFNALLLRTLRQAFASSNQLSM